MPEYHVFSDPYFPVKGQNRSLYGKIWVKGNPCSSIFRVVVVLENYICTSSSVSFHRKFIDI